MALTSCMAAQEDVILKLLQNPTSSTSEIDEAALTKKN